MNSMEPSHDSNVKILAITSGKGGVGKTTLSLNIARQLSLNSLKTLIMDFDIHNKGTTGMFLDRLSSDKCSVTGIVQGSNLFDPKTIPKALDDCNAISLDKKGMLLFVPAAKSDEVILWKNFIVENHLIVSYFRELLHAYAAKNNIDVIIIDCYGGIDNLTVAAAGIADDIIIINEPDIITFSGTLMLYANLREKYEFEERKPRVHFVINRITSRHCFKELNSEYRKHLATLSIDRQILAYFPYDKLVIDSFGEYPFVTELLPRSLLTKKIRILIRRLWPEKKLKLCKSSSTKKENGIFRRTRETIFADPEIILRATFTLPIWFMIPIAIFLFLSKGISGTVSVLQFSILYYSMFVIGLFICGTVCIFEPFQISRWLLRVANYTRRKRALDTVRKNRLSWFSSFFDYIPCFFSVLITLFFAGIVGSGVFYVFSELNVNDISLWPKTISGFATNHNYRNLHLNSTACIKPHSRLDSSNLSYARLSYATLTNISLKACTLSRSRCYETDFDSTDMEHAYAYSTYFKYAKIRHANMSFANLKNADLSYADLRGTKIRYTDLSGADLSYTLLRSTDFTGAIMNRSTELEGIKLFPEQMSRMDLRLTKLNYKLLPGCNLSHAKMDSVEARQAHLPRSNLDSCCLRNAILYEADLSGATLRGADLTNADMRYANLVGVDFTGAMCKGANFKYAIIDSAIFKDCSGLDTSESKYKFIGHRNSLNRYIANIKNLLMYRRNVSIDDTVNLIELLLLRNQGNDVTTAYNLLRGIKNVNPNYHSILLYLSLLHGIIANSADEKKRAMKFFTDFGKIDIWEYDTWNNCFYSKQYTPLQTRKIEIVTRIAREYYSLNSLNEVYEIDTPKTRTNSEQYPKRYSKLPRL